MISALDTPGILMLPDMVEASVADGGPSLPAAVRDTLFLAFVTTRADGVSGGEDPRISGGGRRLTVVPDRLFYPEGGCHFAHVVLASV